MRAQIDPGSVGGYASTMDILPTICDLAGVPPPPDIDGHTIREALVGGGGVAEAPLFLYRDHTLMAVRLGSFKAHFVTRSGFGPDPPKQHDPPLLFNGFPRTSSSDGQVEVDPSEAHPLDVRLYADVMEAISGAISRHR
jgi:arylsulfatase A